MGERPADPVREPAPGGLVTSSLCCLVSILARRPDRCCDEGRCQQPPGLNTYVPPPVVAARMPWKLFLAGQLACLAGFGWCLWQGKSPAAIVFLVGPLQLLLWMVLIADEYRLLVFFAALLPLTGLELLPISYAKWVLYLGTLGTLAFLRIFGFVTPPRPNTKLLPGERIPLLILGVCVVVAGLNAVSRGWGTSELVLSSVRALEVLLAAWFFGVVPRSLSHVRTLIYVMAASIGLTCVCMFILPSAAVEVGELGGKAIQGLFAVVNLNALGAMVGALGIVFIGTLLDAKRTDTRLGLSIVILVMLATFVFTKSRGAWLGFGVALLYVLIRSRSRAFVVLAVAAFGLLLSFDVFRVSLAARAQATGIHDPSLWGRLLLWMYAVKVVKANWLLGVGMENFGLVKHFYGYPLSMASSLAYNAHNLYLEVLADLGVFGFIGFVWAIGGSFLRLDALVRRDVRARAGGYLAVGLAGGIIAYATHGLLDALTWHHGAFMLLGVLIGLASSVSRLAGESARTSRQAAPTAKRVGPDTPGLAPIEPASAVLRLGE